MESCLNLAVFLGRQELAVRSGRSGIKYSAFNAQACVDLRLLGNENLSLSGGLALGLSFMSDNLPCNELFCDVPGSVVLVTPSLRTNIRISSTVSGLLEIRGASCLEDRISTFPYRSGAVVAVGLEFSAASGSSESADF